MSETIGVLGGGQLGRMLAQAASRLGKRVHVFTDQPGSVCSEVCHQQTVAAYHDESALKQFAKSVSAITYEFENVPAQALKVIDQMVPVRPGAKVLEVSQNRFQEKSFFISEGLPTVSFAPVNAEEDLQEALQTVGFPCVLKTQSGGYDGKGQGKANDEAEALQVFQQLPKQPLIVESWATFRGELSVLVARGSNGEVVTTGPLWNEHQNHILHTTIWPAPVEPQTVLDAQALALKVAEGLDLVGVLCVEMFCFDDGSLSLNEIAPRPHNSGHLTIEAFEVSQFELQLRAVLGLPLGESTPRAGAAGMINLLGDLWLDQNARESFNRLLSEPGVFLHLYGKAEARRARKMGHVTLLQDTVPELEQKMAKVLQVLGLPDGAPH